VLILQYFLLLLAVFSDVEADQQLCLSCLTILD
jgi:hypothetical protein